MIVSISLINRFIHLVYRKRTHKHTHTHTVIYTETPSIVHARNEAAKRTLNAEIEYLETAFKSNGYSKNEVKRSTEYGIMKRNDHNQSAGKVYLLRVTDKICQLLQEVNIKTIHKPIRKIQKQKGSTFSVWGLSHTLKI